MLVAIGIYAINQDKFQKKFFAQQYTGPVFRENLLETFENVILPKELLEYTKGQDKIFNHIELNGKHHYINLNSNIDILIAIISKRELRGREVFNLFININHSQRFSQEPDMVNISLGNIIQNPLGFTGKDSFITKIQDELDETKAELSKGIEVLEKRQSEIKKLQTDTFKLGYATKELEDETRKFNDCC